jgi:hypothetical protein
MNIYFLTFYTDGQPLDKGFQLAQVAGQIRERLHPYFDEMFFYNKEKLKTLPNSESFCNEYEEQLSQNANANFIGYFDFKPFIIDYTLKNIPENSILIYHDCNFLKNEQYWESDWPNIKDIALRLLNENNSDVFVQIERDGVFVKEYVKSYVIDRLFPNPHENQIVRNCKLINAARLILRNTPFARNFVNDYLNLCQDKSLLAKSPNDNPDPNFKWSCGDQDVLNCLVYRYILDRKLPPIFPVYSFLYRVMRFDNRPFNWPGQSWNPHPTAASKIYNRNLISYMHDKK